VPILLLVVVAEMPTAPLLEQEICSFGLLREENARRGAGFDVSN
jgi:hypothetical protein